MHSQASFNDNYGKCPERDDTGPNEQIWLA